MISVFDGIYWSRRNKFTCGVIKKLFQTSNENGKSIACDCFDVTRLQKNLPIISLFNRNEDRNLDKIQNYVWKVKIKTHNTTRWTDNFELFNNNKICRKFDMLILTKSESENWLMNYSTNTFVNDFIKSVVGAIRIRNKKKTRRVYQIVDKIVFLTLFLSIIRKV